MKFTLSSSIIYGHARLLLVVDDTTKFFKTFTSYQWEVGMISGLIAFEQYRRQFWDTYLAFERKKLFKY